MKEEEILKVSLCSWIKTYNLKMSGEEVDKTVEILKEDVDAIDKVDGIVDFDENDDKVTMNHKFRQAIMFNNIDIVKDMLNKRLVDINCKQPETLQTPLHIACSSNNIEVVNLLILNQNLERNVQDKYKNRPIDLLDNSDKAIEIRKLLVSTQSEEEGLKSPTEEHGEIIDISKLKGYSNHVFISHDYKDKAVANTLKIALEALGVVVCLTSSMMADKRAVESMVDSSSEFLLV